MKNKKTGRMKMIKMIKKLTVCLLVIALTVPSLLVAARQSAVRPADVPLVERALAFMSGQQTVASAMYNTYVIQDDGSLWAWDRNTNWSDPHRVHVMDNVYSVSASGDWQGDVYILTNDGVLWESNRTWASDWITQIRNIERVKDDVKAFSAGDGQVSAITNDGSLWTWVLRWDGRGNPTRIMGNVVAVCGTFAITDDGRLWGWGSNRSGRLGDGTTTNRQDPTFIMDDVIAVSSGWSHTAAIRSDGSLWAWGSNWSGALGDGTTTDRHRPVRIMEDVMAVSVGGGFTLALRSDGSLWSWGANESGQIGDGSATNPLVGSGWYGPFPDLNPNRYSPVRVMDDVAAIYAGGSALSVAIRNDGSLWAWGSTHNDILANAPALDGRWLSFRSTPVHIMDNAMIPGGGRQTNLLVGSWEFVRVQNPQYIPGFRSFDGLDILPDGTGSVWGYADFYWHIYRLYHHTFDFVTWATSAIRQWLNSEFLARFSLAEQELIVETYVVNNDNPWEFPERGGWVDTLGGDNTMDRIFLLSIDEVLRYFGDSGLIARGAAMGESARDADTDQGLFGWGISDQYNDARAALNLEGSYSWWWLRSPGVNPFDAAIVLFGGFLIMSGNNVFMEDISVGVRPALWLNLSEHYTQ